MNAVAIMTPEPKYFANLKQWVRSEQQEKEDCNALEDIVWDNTPQASASGHDGEESTKHGGDHDDEDGGDAEAEEGVGTTAISTVDNVASCVRHRVGGSGACARHRSS